MEASPEKKASSGTFGPKLKQERQRHHLSQEKLAEMVGCDVRSIRRWEQGKSIPDYENRHRLSKALDITLEHFHQLLQPPEEKGEEQLENNTVVSEDFSQLRPIPEEKGKNSSESAIQVPEALPGSNHSTSMGSEGSSKYLAQQQQRRTLLKWGGTGLVGTLAGGSGLFYWFKSRQPSSAGSSSPSLAGSPSPSSASLSTPLGQVSMYNSPSGASMDSVEWSPNYGSIVCVDGNNIAHLITVTDTNPSQTGLTSSYTRYNPSVKVNTAINCITWSPDGMQLASPTSMDNNAIAIHIWNFNNGTDTHFSYALGIPTSIAWSYDSNSIAIGDMTGMVSTWDVKTYQRLHIYPGHRGTVWRVAWSPSSDYLASAGDDGTVRIWNMTKADHPVIYNGHHQPVYDVKWPHVENDPNDIRIVSASADKTVQIWNSMTGGDPEFIYKQHNQAVRAAEWSSDAQYIASAGADNTIQVWHALTGGLYRTYAGHTNMIMALSWSPNGMDLASASEDGTMRVWHVS